MNILEFDAEKSLLTKLYLGSLVVEDEYDIYKYANLNVKVKYKVKSDIYELKLVKVIDQLYPNTCYNCAFYDNSSPLKSHSCSPITKYLPCNVRSSLKFKVVGHSSLDSVSLSKVKSIICNDDFCLYYSKDCMETVGIELCTYKKIIEEV